MFGFGKKMVPAGTDAPPPNMSLAKWGLPVPVKLDKRFKKAQRLMEAKLYADSSRELYELLEDVIRMEYGLAITAYMHVLLLIAYNHGDLQEYAQGLKLYEQRQQLILQEGEWHKGIPSGLSLMVPESFYEKRDSHLAVNYLEIAIACGHLGRRDQAIESFTLGARHSLRSGSREQAILHCRYLAGLANRTEDWEMMDYAGDLLAEVGGAKPEARVDSLAFHFRACMNTQRYSEALAFAEEITKLSGDEGEIEYYETMAGQLRTLLGRS